MPKLIDDAAVYQATVDVLLANGYAGATTRQIAEAAGINEVTLFRKYGSKAELAAAALLAERASIDARGILYTGDLAADLQAIVAIYSGASPRQVGLTLLIITEMIRYPELRPTLRLPMALIEQCAALVARYQTQGRLRAGEPLLVVGALLGPVIINAMLRSAEPALPIPALDPAAHVATFLHGWAA